METNKKPFDAVQKQYIDAHLCGNATKAQPNPDYCDNGPGLRAPLLKRKKV